MPLKWKIYYLCMFYLLVWAMMYLFYITLDVLDFFLHFSPDFEESVFYVLLFILITAFTFTCVFKPLPGPQNIHPVTGIRFRSAKKRKMFVTGFCIMALFAGLSAFLSIVIVATGSLKHAEDFNAMLLFMAASSGSVFVVVMDFIWLLPPIKKYCRRLFIFNKNKLAND